MHVVPGITFFVAKNLSSVQIEETTFNDGFDRVFLLARRAGTSIFAQFDAQGFKLFGEGFPISHFRLMP